MPQGLPPLGGGISFLEKDVPLPTQGCARIAEHASFLNKDHAPLHELTS